MDRRDAFWSLLAYGLLVGEMTVGRGILLVATWLIGRVRLAHLPNEPAHAMFSSSVAVLHVVMVFATFNGGVHVM